MRKGEGCQPCIEKNEAVQRKKTETIFIFIPLIKNVKNIKAVGITRARDLRKKSKICIFYLTGSDLFTNYE